MKRMIAVLLLCCLLAALSACGTDEIYIHDTSNTPGPAATAQAPSPAETEEPVMFADDSGMPVILSVKKYTGAYTAPDGSDRVILSYGYDDVDVYLEANQAAAEQINAYLDTQDDIYYSGTGNGDGVNAYLELATDNYALSQDYSTGLNLEFSCMRSAYVDRADEGVIAIRYRINSYTGGAHGLYTDRVYVFETANGRLLSVDDLSADREALEQLLLDEMNNKLHNDVRYKPILEYMTAFRPEQELEEQLRALIRDGSWSLDSVGLTVFSDIYELGSYADGIVRFTVPYAELEGVLPEGWMPPEAKESGSLRIIGLNEKGANSVRLLDKVTVSDTGAEFRVYAEGTVYDVSIDSVTYISDDVGFYQTETHWYGSFLSNAGIQVQTEIPDGMPDLMIRYTDGEGLVHSLLITQSGEDGSILLLEEAKVEAVG